MRQSGFSIVEVIVMMVILSFSILGVYSMVNSGQKFAQSTDNRLTALNIARSGIEWVVALRDSFRLRSNSNTACVFTLDGESAGNCPDTNEKYTLKNNWTLEVISPTLVTTPVCITTHGWYSEECSSIPPLVFCGGGTTVECMTRFSRVLSFASCPGVTSPPGIVDCLVITVKVSLNGEDVVTLNQILTRS